MTFQQDAVLRFTGALPSGSSLTISGNSFYQTMMNPNAGVKSLVASIVLGDSYKSLTLAASSQLSVVSNTFTASVSSDYAAIRLQFGNVTVSGSSTLNISANALVNSLLKPFAPSIAVIGWVLYNVGLSVYTTPLTITGQSTVAFNSNSISKTVVVPIDTFQTTFISVINFQFGSGYYNIGNLLTLAGQSVLTLNGNYISNSTNTGLLYNSNGFITVAVNWQVQANGALNVDGGSLLALDNNWVGNHTTFDTAYAVYWQITQLGAGMAVTSGSTISFQDNSIVNTMVGPSNTVNGNRYAYVVCWLIELFYTATSIGTQSKILISGNTMTNVTALANTNTYLFVVDLVVAFGFYVTGSSSVHVDNNAMINTTSPSSQVNVIRAYSSFANIVVDQSTISMASNSLLNSSVKTATVAGWNLETSNLTMVGTSTFTTSSNLAANSIIAQQLSVAIVEFYARAFVLITENSALLINDNAAVACSPIGSWAAIATFQMDQSVNKEYGQVVFTGANIAMSRNTIQSSTVNSLYLCYWNLQWFTVSITDFTAVTLSDNTAQNTIVSGTFYVANLAVGLLALAGNSTFYIQRTSISASAQQFTLANAMSVAISSGSQFRVTQNNIALTAPATSVTGLTFGNTLTLDGYLLVTGNTMTSTGQVGSFSLVNAWAFASNPSAGVYACNNSVAWDSRVFSYPAIFIRPSSLAEITTPCGPALPTEKPESKPDTAVVAGAVAGSVIGVVLLVGAIVFFCRRPSVDQGSAPLMGKSAGKYAAMQ
eukprot:GILJ01014272.1.p1 GENE.GILJ01014272.1~~GILJ01014272.1.p1  ORF type:complete len:769 (+),score=145.45 GILJ01014272.1:149-2455(+)